MGDFYQAFFERGSKERHLPIAILLIEGIVVFKVLRLREKLSHSHVVLHLQEVGPLALSAHAATKLAIVDLAAVHGLDAVEYFISAVGEVLRDPIFKDAAYGTIEAHDDVVDTMGTVLSSGLV